MFYLQAPKSVALDLKRCQVLKKIVPNVAPFDYFHRNSMILSDKWPISSRVGIENTYIVLSYIKNIELG